MMKRFFFISAVSCLLFGTLCGQQKFPFERTVLIEGEKVEMSKYKGRPLIIELFSEGCVVCFRDLPKVKAMHELNKDKIGFLLLGGEVKKLPKIYAAFKEKLNLKFDAGFDPGLFEWINPKFVPWLAWVDADGNVRGQTGTQYFTARYVDEFIAGNYSFFQEANAPPKVSFNDRGLLPAVGKYYRSLFTEANDSFSLFLPDRLAYSPKGPYFQVVNATIDDMYRYAYFGQTYFSYKDSLYGKVNPVIQYEGVPDFLLAIQNAKRYCYSICFPEHRPLNSLKQVMQKDLENQFGYQATLETRIMPYRALIRLDTTDNHLRSRFPVRKTTFSYDSIDYKNVTVDFLLDRIDYDCQNTLPFADETGINYPIDIAFKAMMTDVKDVARSLRKKGLDLIVKNRPVQVLVLRPLQTNVAAN